MEEISEVDFPELFGTHLSAEDQRLLDLWDQGLDCDIISCLSKNKSQETNDSGYESEEHTYIYGEHCNELSESDSDSDSDDESSESDSDSDSDTGSDSDRDSDSSGSDEEEFRPVRELVIFPTMRKGRTPRSMRVQLLKHLTLARGFHREEFCCEEECSVLWRWVKMRAVYRDYL